jgi:uncharacterized membrane protein
MDKQEINRAKAEVKRANAIFLTALICGIMASFVLIAFVDYWIGITIPFLVVFGAAIYLRKVAAKHRLGDERIKLIEEKANALAFKVTFPALVILMIILGGLNSMEIAPRLLRL